MKTLFAGVKKELARLDVREVQLVKFGFIVGGILLLLASLAFWHEKYTTFAVVFTPGFLLFFFGATFPRLLKGPYKIWMSLGFLLGGVIGSVILGTLYYVLVTPIALVLNLVKGSPLEHVSKEGSYWIPRAETWTRESMERLF